jgi:inosine-uridine nucleoside N-ribohydrolase
VTRPTAFAFGWLTPMLLSACVGVASPSSASCTARPPLNHIEPVVVDTDMAPDDWLAILYLLKRPDVNVLAITVTGTGEAHCVPGVRHALDMSALAGHAEVPVACGRETPLEGNHAFPGEMRDAVDSLLGLSLPKSPSEPFGGTAVELLTAVIDESPERVHLVTLGPLTNVAEMLDAEPSLADRLKMITVMGGAVRVPGNVGASSSIDNDVAEWNIYVDPSAAAKVFGSGVPITLVPLDATNYAPLTLEFLERLKKDRATPEAELAYRVLMKLESAIRTGWYYFWDPLAAAVATDERLGSFEDLPLAVVEEEGAESGRTLEGEGGHTVRVMLEADATCFETLLLETLNGRLE